MMVDPASIAESTISAKAAVPPVVTKGQASSSSSELKVLTAGASSNSVPTTQKADWVFAIGGISPMDVAVITSHF